MTKLMDFDRWRAHCDTICERKTGMVCDDLPDYSYWDLWDDGCSPLDAVNEMLEYNGWPV